MGNLAAVETRNGEAPREGTMPDQATIKGKILELEWHLTKEGRRKLTIASYSQFLNLLVRFGANLNDPESVKGVIAKRETWGIASKLMAVNAYAAFANLNKITWTPPKYEQERKLPWIPLEKELDALISSCSRKFATVCQLLKETGMRIGEACRLKWIDLDTEHATITLNSPEKHGQPRMLKISVNLVSMLNALPKENERVFGDLNARSAASNFCRMRKAAAFKLQNPRINSIHLHTFRHWHATMEYSKTKDILHVMQRLGHKRIENTLIYTQLVQFESDQYYSTTASSVEEAQKLAENGWEKWDVLNGVHIYRKRK